MAIDWLEFFSPRIQSLKPGRNEWAKGKCPLHDDKRDSFSLNKQSGAWKCFADCGSGNARKLCELLNIDYPADRRQKPPATKRSGRQDRDNARAPNPPPKVLAIYTYTDENEKPLFRKLRTADKKFWFERPDGKDGWILGLGSARIVPYHLHEIVKAARLSIVEGCKDADTLHAMEFVATTAPFGADRWPEDFVQYFKGKELWVFRDNDPPGQRHQLEAALNCFPVARAVKLIELPGLKDKEDVTDWLNKRHTKEDLLKICLAAPALKEEDLPRLRQELEKLKAPGQTRRQKVETGEDVLNREDLQRRLHPAMEWQDGVLIVGFRYGEKSVWITSKRELLSEAELKEIYGDPRTSPLEEGPTKEACFRWRDGATVDGKELCQRIIQYLHHHVVFQYTWQSVLAAMWILNTYLYRIHPVCPALHVTAPEKASGKTRFLEVAAAISFAHPQLQVDPTEAVLFREPELTAITLFWDEAEVLRRLGRSEPDERLAVINAGYRKDQVVKRFDKNAAQITTHEVYRPMVLSGINRLPDTTASRCLTLELQRKKTSEKIEDFNPSRIQRETAALRDDCYLWALSNAAYVADAYRVAGALPLPDAVHGRLREILEPLFAMAVVLDAADSNGPTTTALREAANHLAGVGGEREAEESARIQMLQILWENFPPDIEHWALKAETCVELCQNNGMDWIEKRSQVQKLLRSWRWKSSTERIEGKPIRGYHIYRRTLINKVERYAPHLLAEPTPEPEGDFHPQG